MKRLIRPEPWLSLCVLMTLLGSAAGEALQPKKPPDQPKVKWPALLSAKQVKEDPRDDAARKLLKARFNEALGGAKGIYEEYLDGGGSSDDLYSSLQRVVKARLELCDKSAEKVVLQKEYVEITKEVEKLAKARYDDGRFSIGDLHRARYERLDAEIQLLRANREAEKAKDR